MKHYPLGDQPLPSELKSLGMSAPAIYFWAHQALHDGLNARAVRTGELRAPKKGEWYLSGAIATAYRAPNDLSSKFHIARLCCVKRETRTIDSIVEKSTA
jgi:hypothetical protein